MASRKRDNDYYLKRLQREHPRLAVEVAAGRMTVGAARKVAGLGGQRSRLHELKNAWAKATPAERDEFARWSGLAGIGPSPAAPRKPLTAGAPSVPAFDGTGRLNRWAKDRILEIMARRNMTSGDVCDELGLKRLDASVMMAVKNGARLKPSTVPLVEAWLARNASV